MKRVSNSDTHVCSRGNHMFSPGTQSRAIKAHVCTRETLEHKYVSSITACAIKAHVCVHVEHTYAHT